MCTCVCTHMWVSPWACVRLWGKGMDEIPIQLTNGAVFSMIAFIWREGLSTTPSNGIRLGHLLATVFACPFKLCIPKHVCLDLLALNTSPIFILPPQQLANWYFRIALDGQISSTICCNLEESSAVLWQLSSSESSTPAFICKRGHISSVRMAISYKRKAFSSKAEKAHFFLWRSDVWKPLSSLQNIAPNGDVDKIVFLGIWI